MNNLANKAAAAVLEWRDRAGKAVPLIDWGRTAVEFGFWAFRSLVVSLSIGFFVFDVLAILFLGQPSGSELLDGDIASLIAAGAMPSEILKYVVAGKLYLSAAAFPVAILTGLIRVPTVVFKRRETAA